MFTDFEVFTKSSCPCHCVLKYYSNNLFNKKNLPGTNRIIYRSQYSVSI